MANSPFSSSSSISSILKGAQSREASIQAFNDAFVANEWDNSAQTYDDFIAYSNYLKDQQSKTTDPMKQLTYTNKIQTAHRTYFSNEVQRQTQYVMEGGQDNRSKYQHITSLYYQAVDNNDFNAAQNLRSTLDSLSITIQNEDAAAASARASAGRSASSAANAALEAQLQDNLDTIDNSVYSTLLDYKALGPSTFDKRLKEEGFSGGLFDLLTNAAQQKLEQYQAAMQGTTDESKLRTYQKSYDHLLGQDAEGNPVKPTAITDLPGAGGVTIKDIKEEIAARQTGQHVFVAAHDGTFVRQQATGYGYGRDASGNYVPVPIYGSKPSGSPNPNGKSTPVTDKATGNKYDTNSFKGLLSLPSNGFGAVNDSKGFLSVNNQGQFTKLGYEAGAPVDLFVDQNGNLQVRSANNPNKIFSLGFDAKTGKYLGLNEQTPNPITLYGSDQHGVNLSGAYIGELLRQNPNYFNELPGGAIGSIDLSSPYARFMEPSTLLAKAQSVQFQKAAVLAAQTAAAAQPHTAPALQPANYNVLNAPANAHISIAQPKPLPTISLPKPQPLPKLTVNNAPNTQTIKVNNQPNTQTIRF